MALPVTFVAGDVLEAAQLNSNFTYVEGLGGFTYITGGLERLPAPTKTT
jgi:hypothetical protein